MDCLCADLDYSDEPAFCPVHPGTHVGVERLRAKCRKRDAEIARLKAEVERANQQPLPSNLGGYQAFRDMVCAALDIEPTWSNEPALAIARLKAEVERLREYERLHGVRSNEIGKLRVDLAAHKRALAAGPAALRGPLDAYVCGTKRVRELLATIVERAQEAAMKEDGHG